MSALEPQHLDVEHPAIDITDAEKRKAYYWPAPAAEEIDYETAYEDITKRFPKIISHLSR